MPAQPPVPVRERAPWVGVDQAETAHNGGSESGADQMGGQVTENPQEEPPAEPTGAARKPSRWRRWRRWLIAALVLALVAVAGLVWKLTRPEEATARSITATASVGEVTRTVSVSGTLEPARDETLSFAVSGTVTKVYVELGDTVAKGDKLAAVDSELLKSQLDAAEATEAAAQDDLTTAEDSGTAAQLAAAQAQLATAQDDLAAAQQAVKDAVLVAPFGGQVVSLDLAVGDVVTGGSAGGSGGIAAGGTGSSGSGSSTSTAGTVQIASVKSFIVDTTVNSSDIKSIKKGLQAQITASGQSKTLYGTVSEVGRVATTTSSGSAAFPVTVELTGKAEGVFGGTSATVAIIVEKRSDVLTVATRAVRSDNGQTYVTLVAADGTTSRRNVTVGQTYGQQTEITEGLTGGESVEVISLPAGAGVGGTGRTGQLPGGGELPTGFPGVGFPGGGGGVPGGGFPGGAPGGGNG